MSREYAQVWPGFWSGETGRAFAQLANDGNLQPQRVAFYLMTCKSATFSGLFYLPLPLLVHELGGITLEGAREALARLSEADFAHYDARLEQVWVVNAATFNIGLTPKLTDNRILGLRRELESQRKSPFHDAFLQHYEHLFRSAAAAPSQAPSKPPRSPSQGSGVSGSDPDPIRSKPERGNARGRARPAPPTRLRPTEQTETPDDVTLTPAHLGTLFDAHWRALKHPAPPLPREALVELADRVNATAADRNLKPAALLEQALGAWNAQPLNDRERRGPVECFARDFSTVVDSIVPPAAAAARDLHAERAAALESGDTQRYEQLNEELRMRNGSGGRHAAAR